jgi:hypothetical protein
MKNRKVIVGVLGVFLLGMVAGGLVTDRVIKKRAQQALTPGSPLAAEIVARRLSWDLGLTVDQRRQVLAIMQETQRELQAARLQIRPQMEQVFAASNGKIRAVLRPDQQEKYDRIVADRRAAWRQPPPERRPWRGGD